MPDALGVVLASDPVNPNHPLNHGRTGWWLAIPGIDGGQQLYDLMGACRGANHGTLTSSPTWGRSYRPGGYAALTSDGSASYVTCGTVAGLQGATRATLAGWVYKPSNAVGAVFGGAPGSGDRFEIQWPTDGNCYFAAEQGGAVPSYGFVALAAGWHRLLMAFDGSAAGNSGRLKGYIDGVAASLSYGGASIPATLGVAAPFTMGVENTSTFRAGSYDDVSIWVGRTLSAADARADYDLSRTGYPGVLNRVGPRTVQASAAAPNPWQYFMDVEG